MQPDCEQLTFVVGDAQTVEHMADVPALPPFADAVLEFLNHLSARLRGCRTFSDVATFGFWCRRPALLREKASYDDLALRLGRGVVFHSTPSNVPVNFAFSFAAGLLAGNANIVRLPGKPFAQVDLICEAITELLAGPDRALAPYVALVKYPPVQAVSDWFSGLCDTRITWGGDATVAELRRSPLKPRANEITFADRHSLAVIDADAYLAAENKERIARDFYNDTYYSDQNACTAPRVVCWLGREKQAAQRAFWAQVRALAAREYTLAPTQAVGKLQAVYRAAAHTEVRWLPGADMLVTRLRVAELSPELMDWKYHSGFFYECDLDSLAQLAPVCGERCQTLTYYGLSAEQLAEFVRACRPRGLDRAVPMGRSMDFALVWDGYDLIRSLSRRITVL